MASLRLSGAVLALGACTAALAQGPEYAWQSGFHATGAGPGVVFGPDFVVRDTSVNCSVMFADGSGPALYIGGFFGSIGEAQAVNVARYIGATSWAPVGAGDANAMVGDLELLSTDAGQVLFSLERDAIGGATNVRRWNGTDWTDASAGLPEGVLLNDLVVFTEPGPTHVLYAGGGGDFGPGQIFRFDGAAWSEIINTGIQFPVQKLYQRVRGDGPPELIAGAGFLGSPTTFGQVYVTSAPASGNAWSTLGGSIGLAARSFLAVNVENGVDLYMAGTATFPPPQGGVVVLRGMAGQWEAAGSPALASPSRGHDLKLLDLGKGPQLVAAGEFTVPGGGTALAALDGDVWTPLISSMGQDQFITASLSTVAQLPGTTDLLVGGRFSSIESVVTSALAVRRDGTWTVATARGHGFIGDCQALAVLNDPVPRLFAGGFRSKAGITPGQGIFGWNNSFWAKAGTASPEFVNDLAVVETPNGPELYAGGLLAFEPPFTPVIVTRWTGTDWETVATTGNVPFPSQVNAMIGFEGALFAGGTFFQINGQSISTGVARFFNGSWTATSNAPGGVTAFGVLAGRLYAAGGSFGSVMSRWNSASQAWEQVTTADGPIEAMASFNGRLYIGGRFAQIASLNASNIVSYDGASWSTVGAGANDAVMALHVFDDGTGAALFAGGKFTEAGGAPAPGVARWDGSAWSGVDGGIGGVVQEFATFADDRGPALYAGGVFTRAGEHVSVNVAKFGRVGPACAGDWNNDTVVNSQDLFDFLRAFFAGFADFNKDGVTNSQDFFDFVEAFLAEC